MNSRQVRELENPLAKADSSLHDRTAFFKRRCSQLHLHSRIMAMAIKIMSTW